MSPADTLRFRIKVLILPHFEIGELTGDTPGEAQFFYERYIGDAGTSCPLPCGRVLYFNEKNGVALCVTGSGKVNTALTLTSVLSDPRFDLDGGYIISVGCGGGAAGVAVPGDVCIATAACDFDLGHTVDAREYTGERRVLWYHDPSYDDVAFKRFDGDLVFRLAKAVADTPLETTPLARETVKRGFGAGGWADRNPRVLTGVVLTGDNFWKGRYGHEKADAIVAYYLPGETYTITEMEDIALADVADAFGLLDRCLSVRVAVNTDVFINGETPETLWGGDRGFNSAADTQNGETLDVFGTAMRNGFAVGRRVIDALLDGTV